jgi:predicted component of viral defense system (DUF524 family)
LSNCESLHFLDAQGKTVGVLKIFAPPSEQYGILKLSSYDALDAGEEELQLLEGTRYEYELEYLIESNLILEEAFGNGIIERSKNPKLKKFGTLNTGLKTGRLDLVLKNGLGLSVGRASLEIRSRKISYRNDYRIMLEEITEYSLDLLSDINSSTVSRLKPEPGNTSESIQQKFAFLRSLLDSHDFVEAIKRIITHPNHILIKQENIVSSSYGFRPSSKINRQIAKSQRRIKLPESHILSKKINSIPEFIENFRNIETFDTLENRFVKFSLENFNDFLRRMRIKLESLGGNNVNLGRQISSLENKLENFLLSDFFKNVEDLAKLPLGSTVLHRKEGYREVFGAWLKFDMAARLVWHGGDDVYGVGKRDISTLYEYWVFFKLIEIITKIFKLSKPVAESLLEQTSDGFGLKLKSGRHIEIQGSFLGRGRELKIRFSYNRTFSHNRNVRYSGSWSERMRPDYTLSLWPAQFSESEAEAQELMVHVHFDAKYRVEKLTELFGATDNELDEVKSDILLNLEKQEQREGRYKRADLLKMHAYHDAIRRTYGAYVLYPGEAEKKWDSYTEILPGIGAFAMKPGQSTSKVEEFIQDIVFHVCDRASARERNSFYSYQVREAPAPFVFDYSFPERSANSHSRHKPPSETYVVIDTSVGESELNWISNSNIYAVGIDSEKQPFHLQTEFISSEYLILIKNKINFEVKFFRIISKDSQLISRSALMEKGLMREKSGDFFLVFNLEKADEFDGIKLNAQLINTKRSSESIEKPLVMSLDQVLSIYKS